MKKRLFSFILTGTMIFSQFGIALASDESAAAGLTVSSEDDIIMTVDAETEQEEVQADENAPADISLGELKAEDLIFDEHMDETEVPRLETGETGELSEAQHMSGTEGVAKQESESAVLLSPDLSAEEPSVPSGQASESPVLLPVDVSADIPAEASAEESTEGTGELIPDAAADTVFRYSDTNESAEEIKEQTEGISEEQPAEQSVEQFTEQSVEQSTEQSVEQLEEQSAENNKGETVERITEAAVDNLAEDVLSAAEDVDSVEYSVEIYTEDYSDMVLRGNCVTLYAQARCERNGYVFSEEALAETITYHWDFDINTDDEEERNALKSYITVTPVENNQASAEVSFVNVPVSYNRAEVIIKVSIEADGEVKAEQTHSLYMGEAYLQMWPMNIEDLDLGETTTITPEIRQYPADTDTGYRVLDADKVRFEFEINDDQAYEIDEDEDNPGTYRIKRLKDYDTCFAVKGFVRNQDGQEEWIDYREYGMSEKDYNFSYDIQGNDEIFSDGSRTFGFYLNDLESLEDVKEFELVPKAGTSWDEATGTFNNPVNEGEGWTYDREKHEITFDGKVLREKGIDRIETRIFLTINGIVASRNEARGFDVVDLEYNPDSDMKDQTLFVGEERSLSKSGTMYIRNSYAPDGGSFSYIISNLQYNSNEDEYDSRNAINVSEEDDEWKLKAVRWGEEKLTAEIKVMDGSQTVSTLEHQFFVWVGDRRINMYLAAETGSNRLQSGGTLKIYTRVYGEEYNLEKNEYCSLDTSEYSLEYKVECRYIDEELVNEKYNGDSERAAFRGELWDYTEDKSDRSITLEAKNDADNIELVVNAWLIEPGTEERYEAEPLYIYANAVEYEVVLLDQDKKEVDWDQELPPGAETQIYPSIALKGNEDNTDNSGISNIVYHLNWYPGNEDENDPAHITVQNKNDEYLNPGDPVYETDFPLTIMRQSSNDFQFFLHGEWTCQDEKSGEAERSLYCKKVSYSEGFIKDHDRGESWRTWYYDNEAIDIKPDREKLDQLQEDYPGVTTTMEMGFLDRETGNMQPILDYEIDNNGKRGNSTGNYDISNIFSEKEGLKAEGEDLRKLQKILAYQDDEWGNSSSRVELRFKSELNGVVLADYFMELFIDSPHSEIVGLKRQMGPGEEQIWEYGNAVLYVADSEHDTGIFEHKKRGTYTGVVITDIRVDESASEYMSAVKDEESGKWILKALKETEEPALVTFTLEGEDVPEEYTSLRTWIDVSGTLFQAKIVDQEENEISRVELFVDNDSQKLKPMVYCLEYEQDGENFKEKKSLIPEKVDASDGYSYKASYENHNEGVIEVLEDGTINPLRIGSSNIDVNITIYNSGEECEHIWIQIPVEVVILTTELSLLNNSPVYIAPGESLTAEDIGEVVKPVLTIYSLKNREGKKYDISSLYLEEIDVDQLILSEGEGGRFNKLSAAQDALADSDDKIEANLILGSEANAGIYADCSVKIIIQKRAVTGVELKPSTLALVKGNSATLTATVSPSNATNKTVTWTSSDSSVASVLNGKVTAKKAGTAKITVRTADGSKEATCTVTVTNPKVSVTKVSLNKTSLTLEKGKSETLTATVTPSNATNKAITWSSSNTSVAAVSNGKITAKNAGTATITVKTADGSKTARCTVTVDSNTQAFARRLYKLCLNRDPDAAGLNNWVSDLTSGKITAADAVQGFFYSNEMNNLNLSDSEWVERCYQVMMGRGSDAGGKAGWVKVLQEQMKKDVLKGFIDSTEFTGICNSYGITKGTISDPDGLNGFIARCYNKVLRRDYDQAGLDSWVNIINNDASWGPTRKERAISVASRGFFESQEFLNRNTSNEVYVKTLYRTFLGREADTAGYTDWVNQMNSGKTRAEILNGFAYSAEFNNILNSYGIS